MAVANQAQGGQSRTQRGLVMRADLAVAPSRQLSSAEWARKGRCRKGLPLQQRGSAKQGGLTPQGVQLSPAPIHPAA